MKKLSVLLLISILLITTGCGKKDKELVLATEAGFAPYEYYEDGKIVGVDIDISKEIAKELDLDLKIKDVAFDSIINEVKSGKADFGAAGISYKKERAKEVDFSINYSVARQVIVTTKKSRLKNVDNIDKNKKMRIAVQLGSVSDSYVTDNFKNSEIIRQKKILAAIQDLKTDKVDFVVIDELPAKEILNTNEGLKILDGILFEDNYGMIVKKGNTKLLTDINRVLTRLQKEGKIDSYIIKHTTK